MGLAQRVTTPMTVDEFRTWADRQPGRWELVDGQPRAMSPASSTHGFIQARAAYLVERHIEASGNPCRSATEPPVILVADDARVMRMLVRTWLERLGFSVLEAASGSEAVKAARDVRPDALQAERARRVGAARDPVVVLVLAIVHGADRRDVDVGEG